jgi:Na+-driven multidrug efflux pump
VRPPVTLAATYRFFTPLIVMTALTLGSSSIIHAALARMEHPKLVLAAFAVAMSFHGALGGPVWATPYMALTVLRDRATLRQLLRFMAWISVALGAVDLLVAFSPLGEWLYGTLLGASEEVVRQARWCTLILWCEFPLVAVRSTAMSLVMLNRRTHTIPFTTGVRVASLLGFLALLPLWMEGAMVGAAAFIACIVLETAHMVRLAWPAYRALPAGESAPPRFGELWRFGWPLMASQTAEFGVPLVVNFFLGRVARADLALAAFGVMNGLVRVLLGPLRNLTHVAQTLATTREELRVVLRFSWQVIAGFSALLVLLFYTPASGWILRSLLGLTAELADYIAPAMLVTLLIGVFWGASSLLRGLVTNTRRTAPIAWGSALRVVVVAAFGAATLRVIEGNGAVIAILALTAAFAAETLLLGVVLLRQGGSA